MILALSKVLLQSYRLHYLRVLLVLAALIAATAGLSAVLLLNQTARISYQQAQQPFLQQVNWQILATQDGLISKTDYAALRRAGFTQLVPVLQKYVEVPSASSDNPDRSRFLPLLGIDLFAVLSLRPSNRDLTVSAQDNFSLQMLWREGGQTLVHRTLVQRMGLQEGQILQVERSRALPPLYPIEVSGLNNELIVDIGIAQQVFDVQGISAIWVIGEMNQDEVQTLKAALPGHLKLEQLNTSENAVELTDSFHLNLLAMALLMFIVAMFVVMNALQLLISSRLAMLRQLRQLGVSRLMLLVVQSLEMVALSVVATLAGVLMGGQLAGKLSPAVFSTLRGLYDVRISAEQPAAFSLFGLSLLICLVGTLLATALPFWQLNRRLASSSPPLADEKHSKPWLWCALALLMLAGIFLPFATSMSRSFALIALLIFAGCSLLIYLLPVCIRGLLNRLSKGHPLLHWAVADSLRISRFSKIALCAFFIAVAANVGMNLMVDSFRQATHDWLSQRLHAPYYVYSQDNPALLRTLKRAGLDKNIVARRKTDASYAGLDIDLASYPVARQHRDALVFARALPDPWPRFVLGDSVFVNQQFAYAFDLELGQSVLLDLEGEKSFVIGGIYYDYGNPEPAVLLPLSYVEALPNQISNFAVFEQTKNQLDAIRQALKDSGIDAQWFATPELLDLSMQTFDRTFEITRSLNIVTLLVAAFSLASSILLLAADNAPQQSLLMAFGVSKQWLFWLCLGQYLLLSLLVVVLALPFGAALSWLLINLVNVQAFRWSYPLVASWYVFAQVMALGLFMVLAAVSVPLFAQRKQTVMERIKWLN